MYDLIIIGGGPGGIAAGVYAERKRLKTLLLAEEIGGQSLLSVDIQNWIGITTMPGFEMAERLEKHLKTYANDILEYKTGVSVSKLEKISDEPRFKILTKDGQEFETRAVILVTGSHRRRLEAPGAEKFDGKGIVYCASCDAPLFKDKNVAVVGGGNSALEAVQQLLEYASSITMFVRRDFSGDKVTQERVLQNTKVKVLKPADITEIKGKDFVESLVYKNLQTGEAQEIPMEGVFVEIGSIPNSDMVKGFLDLDSRGEVVINHKTARTSVEGIWAAGDVTDQPYKQNNISMGDAVKALEDAYLWLASRK